MSAARLISVSRSQRVYVFAKVVSRVKAGHKFSVHEEFFSIMRLILLRLRREIHSVFVGERTPRSASVIHFV